MKTQFTSISSITELKVRSNSQMDLCLHNNSKVPSQPSKEKEDSNNSSFTWKPVTLEVCSKVSQFLMYMPLLLLVQTQVLQLLIALVAKEVVTVLMDNLSVNVYLVFSMPLGYMMI